MAGSVRSRPAHSANPRRQFKSSPSTRLRLTTYSTVCSALLYNERAGVCSYSSRSSHLKTPFRVVQRSGDIPANIFYKIASDVNEALLLQYCQILGENNMIRGRVTSRGFCFTSGQATLVLLMPSTITGREPVDVFKFHTAHKHPATASFEHSARYSVDTDRRWSTGVELRRSNNCTTNNCAHGLATQAPAVTTTFERTSPREDQQTAQYSQTRRTYGVNDCSRLTMPLTPDSFSCGLGSMRACSSASAC